MPRAFRDEARGQFSGTGASGALESFTDAMMLPTAPTAHAGVAVDPVTSITNQETGSRGNNAPEHDPSESSEDRLEETRARLPKWTGANFFFVGGDHPLQGAEKRCPPHIKKLVGLSSELVLKSHISEHSPVLS
jgi:hypothetical protein